MGRMASGLPATASPEAENRLKGIAVAERPQERLEHFGAGALSDTELLALLLRSGTRGHDVLTLASRLIAEAGSLGGLIDWCEADFRRLRGIGRVKALQLLAAMELARRVVGGPAGESPPLTRADLVAAYLQPHAAGLAVEKFWVLCLNRKNRLIKRVEVTSGTATAALAHPREVFRVAIRESSSAIVCAHNHPSGDCAPSSADVQLTRLLREAARTVEIDLLDHVILLSKALDNRIYPQTGIMLSGGWRLLLLRRENVAAARAATWDNYWASRNDSRREKHSGPRRRRGLWGCWRSCMHSRFILRSAWT